MRATVTLVGLMVILGTARPARAYIEAPMSFGDVVNQSNMITLLRVTRVDKANKLIVYEKVEDIRGKFPTATARHIIGGQLKEGEIKTVLDWAEAGKYAVFFAKDGACETCIDMYWYQIYKQGDDLYSMSHGEPFLLRSYAGKPERLPPLVRAILDGKEIPVPCMEDNKDLLHKRAGRIQRLKVSLKILTYDPKRDFAGWGGEDIRRIPGGTGFSHIGPLSRVDAEARSVSAIDFDNDGKLDVCVAATGGVKLFQNQGDSYSEVSLPGLRIGARTAAWGDYNADGKPDLLLATSEGAKLFTNLGAGAFRDDSAILPRGPAAVTSAAWIDADMDGKPDIALATAFNGMRLYRNNPPPGAAAKLAPPRTSDWKLVGPFPNNFDMAFQPEKEIDFQKQYDGKAGKVAWKKADFKDGQINNLAIFGKPELNNECTVYLHREIEVGVPMDLPLSLGSDDGLAVFVNGERVLAENTSRACAADQNRLSVRLKTGKNNVLLKITQGNGEFAFYYSAGQPKVEPTAWFQDLSTSWGIPGDGRIDSLAVADFDGDGKPDLLADAGRIYLNAGGRFNAKADTGMVVDARQSATVADFDGDGLPDLFVPQSNGKSRLFRNQGKAKFVDVIDKCGDLSRPVAGATSAAWGDFDNDGLPDLIVGCLRGANRFFRNAGDGTFSDQTSQVGLVGRIFNTQAIAWADLNGDGKLDLIMANEGQEAAILFGNKELPSPKVPVVVHVPGVAIGGTTAVRITGPGTQLTRSLSGGASRGQPDLAPRFVVAPGAYKVEVRDGTGKTVTKDVTVAGDPMKLLFDEPIKK